MTVTGIDISHWQGAVDWDQLNANPDIGFVIMKATEGTTFVDSRFAANWAACKKPKAPYHFWRYATDGVTQARHFAATVAAVAGDAKVRPVIDLEDSNAPKKGSIYSNMAQFEDETRARFDSRVPLVYTAAWWWDAWVGTDMFRADPLWVAHYTTASNPTLPRTGGWTSWKIWQYTSSGRVPGIAGNVDMNWFNGTQDDLNAFFYSDAPPPSTDPLEPRVAALERQIVDLGNGYGEVIEILKNVRGAIPE